MTKGDSTMDNERDECAKCTRIRQGICVVTRRNDVDFGHEE